MTTFILIVYNAKADVDFSLFSHSVFDKFYGEFKYVFTIRRLQADADGAFTLTAVSSWNSVTRRARLKRSRVGLMKF